MLGYKVIMRRAVLMLALLLSAVTLSARDIRDFVRQQMADYPKAHLLDIYKSCFQDYMGAEHLISDSERVKVYLDQELATTDIDEMSGWYYEPCGTEGHFVRVSLRVVKEGIITSDDLLGTFLHSVDCVKRPSVKSWKRQWRKMMDEIDKMNLDLPDYDREKRYIDSLLNAGKYAVSHSPEYRDAYHPHYRIIERSVFEQELKPLIDRRRADNAMNPICQRSPLDHSPSVFIVMYDPETGKGPLLEAIKRYKAGIIYDYSIIPGMAIKKPDDMSLEEAMGYFKTVDGVVSVEFDHICRLTDPVTPRRGK